jgi:hypothetical protein
MLGLLVAALGIGALGGSWGTGSTRASTAAAVGLTAIAIMLVITAAAAAEWLRQCRARRSLPPAMALTGRLAMKVLGSVRIMLPGLVIVLGADPLNLARGISAVAWLSDRHAWLPRGYPTVTAPGVAWGSLAVGGLLAAIPVLVTVRLVFTVREDVRSVTKVPAPPDSP